MSQHGEADVVDTIKATVTYLTACLVALGGLVMLYLSRADTSAADTRVVIASIVGGSLTFLYGQEVSTRTARQTVTAVTTNGKAPPAGADQGVASGNPG